MSTQTQINNLVDRLMEFEKWPKRKKIDHIAEKVMGWKKGVFREGMEGFPFELPPNQPCWLDKNNHPIRYAGMKGSEKDLGWNPFGGSLAMHDIWCELIKESQHDKRRWERLMEIIEMLLLHVYGKEVKTESIVLFMTDPQHVCRALALLPE